MGEKFSFLDKDQKTYEHTKLYFEAMLNNENLTKVDIFIQKKELELHLKTNCKEHDHCEETNWVSKNSKPLRNYLNSLKTLALFACIDSKIHLHRDFTFELFTKIVDVYDFEKNLVIETIRLE